MLAYWHDDFCHKNDAAYVVICEAEERVVAVATANDDNEADGGIGGVVVQLSSCQYTRER